MKDIFQGLNSRQVEAVKATEGRIRVVAGAGTGKTKALTHRYAYIVNVLGIDPANILCLTFTNKAAAEMRSRISEMVQSGDYNDFVCTLHGFCVKFLRKEIYRLGFPKSFTILDEEDSKAIAKRPSRCLHSYVQRKGLCPRLNNNDAYETHSNRKGSGGHRSLQPGH